MGGTRPGLRATHLETRESPNSRLNSALRLCPHGTTPKAVCQRGNPSVPKGSLLSGSYRERSWADKPHPIRLCDYNEQNGFRIFPGLADELDGGNPRCAQVSKHKAPADVRTEQRQWAGRGGGRQEVCSSHGAQDMSAGLTDDGRTAEWRPTSGTWGECRSSGGRLARRPRTKERDP